MSKKEIYIYGAGGLGREILSLVRIAGNWKPLGFIDDGMAKGVEVAGLKVLGGKDVLLFHSGEVNVIVAIGDPCIKGKIVDSIRNPGIFYPVLIHPSVILQDSDTIRIGPGSIITAGCVLTTQITIGRHVLINLNTTVGHDAHIGNFSSVMPGVNIAGEVHIGKSVLIGSGANILNRVHIGDSSKVGMGAVVIHPVDAGTTVVGVPAKTIRQ